jgi:hypothetical protein
MADQFHIERYRRSNREQVFELMRVAYQPSETARQIKQWDWRHDANPFNADAERYRIANRTSILPFVRAGARPEDVAAMELQNPDGAGLDQPYCIMMMAGEQLAGIHCMIPQRFMVGGGWHWANIPSNFIVHPAYRGQGLSVRLSLTMRADNALMVGFANPSGQRSVRSAVRLVRGKASEGGGASNREFVAARRLTPLFKPIDWGAVAGYFSRNGIVKRSAEIIGAGVEAARGKIFGRRSTRAADVVEVASFDDRIETLWTRACRDYSVLAARDRRYLNWRFLARPDASYRYLIALHGENIVGYMVFRVAMRDRMLSGYVIDYLIENRSREVFSLLLEQAEKSMVDEGAKVIICVVAVAPYRSMFRRSGYFAARTASTPHMNVLCHSGDRVLEVFTDLSKWFLTMGDGDLDFSY